MSKQDEAIKNLADDFATKFIQNHTIWELDGMNHRRLVAYFLDFAKQLDGIKAYRQVLQLFGNEWETELKRLEEIAREM